MLTLGGGFFFSFRPTPFLSPFRLTYPGFPKGDYLTTQNPIFFLITKQENPNLYYPSLPFSSVILQGTRRKVHSAHFLLGRNCEPRYTFGDSGEGGRHRDRKTKTSCLDSMKKRVWFPSSLPQGNTCVAEIYRKSTNNSYV